MPEDMFELHERAFLLEMRLKLEDKGEKLGCFILEGKHYIPLEEKIYFLIGKFSHSKTLKLKKGDTLWQEFQEFKNIRDALIHPKQDNPIQITTEDVRKYIDISKEVIQFISESLWGKKIIF